MHILIGLYLLYLNGVIGSGSDNHAHSYVLITLGVIAGLQIFRMVQKMVQYKIPFTDNLYWNVVYITHLLLIAPLFITLGLKRRGRFSNVNEEQLKKLRTANINSAKRRTKHKKKERRPKLNEIQHEI